MASELKGLELIEAKLEIERLNADFCFHLDHDNVDLLIDLFTEDACYSHGDRLSVGREKIRYLFSQRLNENARTARHMYSGLRLELSSANKATGTSVCMTFAKNAMPPVTPAVPYLVADFIDEYERSDDRHWRISKRHIKRIFVDPNNEGPIGHQT